MGIHGSGQHGNEAWHATIVCGCVIPFDLDACRSSSAYLIFHVLIVHSLSSLGTNGSPDTTLSSHVSINTPQGGVFGAVSNSQAFVEALSPGGHLIAPSPQPGEPGELCSLSLTSFDCYT